MNPQDIKNRFGIIGTAATLDRAIDTAWRVSSTDLTVLITGESGTGKEVFSKVIHHSSSRKHGPFIAVNCGAIPEGTIDSELFGHEKGSFTGASDARKGYFEVANGGTIFLDEVAELPLQTQVRLLRVLETGEFIKVGSSKSQKTDARIVAATNVNIPDAIDKGKFREDLYYRLNTVPINIPPLRERANDILLLFRKFAADFAEKYRMPTIRLSDEAQQLILGYRWPGNVRQLKNITEQISIIETERVITRDTLLLYLPVANEKSTLPMLFSHENKQEFSERELLYKVLFDMKKDMNELKKLVLEMMDNSDSITDFNEQQTQYINKLHAELEEIPATVTVQQAGNNLARTSNSSSSIEVMHHEMEDESLSIEDREKELIVKALEKYKGKRKNAAKDLGISERTLYRKIKEYNLAL